MIISEVLVPLLNTNEPEARVVTIHAGDGNSVNKGELLFTIETTKTASEIESPNEGFLRLLVKEGDTLSVGARLAVITETAQELLPDTGGEQPLENLEVPVGSTIRITKPAQKLIESLGVDISLIPKDRLVTENVVREIVFTEEHLPDGFPSQGKNALIIFGGGGHAKTVIELLKQLDKHTIVGIIDDDRGQLGQEILGVKILGSRALLHELRDKGVIYAVNCVGGILDIGIRVKIFDVLKEHAFTFPTLVHPRATIESSTNLGEGVQVFANAYVGSGAILHAKSMINTNAVVSHDCVIGEHTHIAPGALLAGQVEVGSDTLVGMGVTTAIKVKIGSRARIGNGAIILSDVPDHSIIQAGSCWVGKSN